MTRANYWNLLRELTITQIKLKDQSTFFGLLWSFLNPLLLVAVLYLFFQARLGQDIQHYALFLLIGVVHYNHFAQATNVGMRVLQSLRQLTTEVVFPKELLVLSSVLSNSFEFVLEIPLVVLIAAWAGVPLTSALLWLPVVMLLQFCLSLWVALSLAALFVYVRDLEHLYGIFLRLLFFITPVFYAPAFLGDTLAFWLVRLNPLAQLMTFSRAIILEGIPPPLEWFALLFVFNGVTLVLAWRLFKFMEPRYAERV